jgi:glycerate kinase
MQHYGAEVQSGADLLLDLIQFDKRAKNVDLVITGEGSSDRQTLMGKLPQRIMQRARRLGVPTWLVAGRVSDKQLLLDAGFSRVVCINPAGSPPEECMRPEVARMRLHRAMAMQVQSL